MHLPNEHVKWCDACLICDVKLSCSVPKHKSEQAMTKHLNNFVGPWSQIERQTLYFCIKKNPKISLTVAIFWYRFGDDAPTKIAAVYAVMSILMQSLYTWSMINKN